MYFTAVSFVLNEDKVYRPKCKAFDETGRYTRPKVMYWYSRVGEDNAPFLNIKRTTATGKVLATNMYMTNVPELISNAVFFYMVTRMDPYKLCYVLQNSLDMVMNSANFDMKKWAEFELANPSDGIHDESI